MVDAGLGGGADDAALVAAACEGDQRALAEIFDRYAPRIHGFCHRVLGDPHTAADATQDTFIVAARRLDQLRDPSKLRPWLYAIARNECTRQGRARDRAMPVDDVSGYDDREAADEPGQAAVASEAAAVLWAAADGLDDRDRVLLELQVRHGLEGQELAEAAGIAPGQISMATGRLRERLERAIGALLVARGARKDCPALRVVLDDWDGTYSVLVRKRVARHIDGCEICEDRRRTLVAPFASLAVAPPIASVSLWLAASRHATDALRSSAVDAMALARAEPVPLEPWGPDGFPPSPWDDADLDAPDDLDADPSDEAGDGGAPPPAEPSAAPADADPESARRRRLVGALVLIGILLLAALIAAVRAGDDGSSTASTGAGATTTDAGGEPRSGSAPDGATSTTLADRSTTTGSEATTSTTGATTTSSAPTASVPTTTTPSSVTLVPQPTAVPTTAPPADASPTIGTPVRSGSSSMQTSCNPSNSTRAVTVTANDDRGVAGVVLQWNHADSGPGSRAMTRGSGSTWTVTLGPFAAPGSVTYRAVATDTGGHTISSSTAMVSVDPCPG